MCPLSDLFINIPSISRWKWHPFTVAAIARDSVTLHIKRYGNFTQVHSFLLCLMVPCKWICFTLILDENPTPQPIEKQGQLDKCELKLVKYLYSSDCIVRYHTYIVFHKRWCEPPAIFVAE